MPNTYHLGVEDIEPNHYVAYVLELPGCFGNGKTSDAAIASARERLAVRLDRGGPPQVEVAEVFNSWSSSDDYIVNAFFEADRRPLTAAEIKGALKLLNESRRALLQVVARVPQDAFDRDDERAARGSITGTLLHIANAEAWYLDRLDLAPAWEQLPADPLARLESVRAHTLATLPALAGDARITELQGEHWSARKVLRRTLWHEADHTNQIAVLI
ncbi:MAG: DinB family protein [Anaerolineales bacterium]